MSHPQGDAALRRATHLNRSVLICNLAVLACNAFVAFSATDSQAGLAESTMRLTAGGGIRRFATPDPSPAYLRVVQGIEGAAPPGALGREQLRCVYDAVLLYYEVVSRGVPAALSTEGGAEATRQAFAELGRDARGEVERELGSTFRDAALVTRLATDILRECR